MILSALAAALLGHAPPVPVPVPVPVQYAQLTIRQRLVVRVPALAIGRPGAAAAPDRYKESKGPKCLPVSQIAGAAVTEPGSVDLIVRGGERFRARFARSCPDLDYYGGFYVLPTADGRVCADRDQVHARSGGECEIERFRTLTPRNR